jgi:peptide subunit release factor 1 (eRF1)
VVAIDNDSCGIGIIDSATGNWECLDEQTSGVGGKSGKGGSSQRRYERNRAAELNGYYHRCAEHINNLFLNTYQPKEIILAGPSLTKDEFVKKGYLDYRLVSKVSKPYMNIEYAGLEGVAQVRNRIA